MWQLDNFLPSCHSVPSQNIGFQLGTLLATWVGSLETEVSLYREVFFVLLIIEVIATLSNCKHDTKSSTTIKGPRVVRSNEN